MAPARVPRHAATGLAAAIAIGATVGLGSPAASARPGGTVPRATTSRLARTVINDLRPGGGSASALVVDQTTGRILVSLNPVTPRLPASVEKLFTTAAALFQFGPSHGFTTSLETTGAVRGHTLHGTLYLRGGGDPTFGSARFDRAAYGTGATMQQLLERLHDAGGIHAVDGAIDGDASIFDTHGGAPDTGDRADSETEGELSGLSYDAGFTDTTETALQPDPAAAAATALADAAPAAHISVTKPVQVRTTSTPTGARTLATVSSPPLSTLLQLTNAPSDNFFAETLLKDIAAATDPAVPASTAAGASDVTNLIATRLGLSVHTDDGSGLSRYDRTTAQSLVDLLEEMSPSAAFTNSLAIAGRTGTLKDAMRGTVAQDHCSGKTGTLHDVADLAGYCTAADGHRLAFAFLENSLRDADAGHQGEYGATVALARYQGDGQGPPFPAPPRPGATGTTTRPTG